MTDRPILFSGPMVQALLSGRKTQTRRVIKTQPPSECSISYMLGNERWAPVEQRTPARRLFEAWGGDLYDQRPHGHLCGLFEITPHIQPGDHLWVREAIFMDAHAEEQANNGETEYWPSYRADNLPFPDDLWVEGWHPTARNVSRYQVDVGRPPEAWGWSAQWVIPSIHMPRWASRITLEVTDVRVERVQDISEADALAEGVLWVPGHGEITSADLMADPGYSNFLNCREGYQYLWESLNASRGFGWDTNPWVVAVTFTVHKCNIDRFDPATRIGATR